MKWEIELRGHTAILEVLGNPLKAEITSSEFGIEEVSNFQIEGAAMSGEVEFDGLDVQLSASIQEDGSIKGYVRAGWFFNANFIGTPVT